MEAIPDPADPLRRHLLKILDWRDAHVDFDAAVEGVAPKYYGIQPEGLPHSLWQLVEHIRVAQHDILEFCRNRAYKALNWPNDYWPEAAAPPSPMEWAESIAGYRADREALQRLVAEGSVDLFGQIPHGQGQTYLREILLVADHTAYHTGQIILVRRLLGIWD